MSGEIFISYRRADEPLARMLHSQLKEQGVEAWYDAHVGAGEDWRAATAKALQASRIFVLLFSTAAAESQDIAKELAAATFSKKLVVPVRIENIEPSGAFLYELASRNWVNAFENTEAKLAELAQSLAKLVKAGIADESIIPFDRNAGAKPVGFALNRRSYRLIGAGVALALLLAGAVAIFGHSQAGAPPSGRTAFFGIDAPEGDPAALAIAAAAENTITTTFSAQQQDMASRADIEGTPRDQRLDRAISLGATYAVSGAVTRQDDKAFIALQIEDAPSHTLLWAETIDGRASETTRLATRAAALVTDTLSCVASVRSSLSHDDLAIVSKLPQACRSGRGQRNDQKLSAELARLAPSSASLHARNAVTLGRALSDDMPPERVKQTQAEVIAEADRAFNLAPNDPDVQLARMFAAQARGATDAELEAVFVDGLKRAPDASSLSNYYGTWLVKIGRAKDALHYLRFSVERDPLSAAKPRALAEEMALLGLTSEAASVFARLHESWPSAQEWSSYIAAAVFRRVGDVEAVLADPPADLSAQTLACWIEIARAHRATGGAPRKRGAARAAECYASGAIPLDKALMASAFLGDLDTTFRLADTPTTSGISSVLFDPHLPAFRADPRFAPLMERYRLLAYWQDSGKQPDFCKTENAPVCASISLTTKPSSN